MTWPKYVTHGLFAIERTAGRADESLSAFDRLESSQ